MKVIYNQPIAVKTEYYGFLMKTFSGILAGRKDENGQYFVKLLWFPLKKYVQKFIDQNPHVLSNPH